MNYCQQYHVDLCADKTKLLMINKASRTIIHYNPITLNGQQIPFAKQAEHVGVIRSPDGNLPHLLGRILAHKKAKGAILSSGIARRHRGNQAAAVRLETIYGVPVLLSGVSSLVLSSWEINIIDHHYRETLNNLLKLYPGTPHAFIFFMSGSLPGKALLHQRQLSLFSMICHLPDDPLHARAKYVLTCLSSAKKSWFSQVRDICLFYGLPHPLDLLNSPLSKESFKKLSKSLILDYWETKFRGDASGLDSLLYFKPEYHSLSKPHPLLWTAGPNPYEVSKAVIQCKMLSGRYRTELLASHWSQNKFGYCLTSTCESVPETLEHILLWCPSYQPVREKLRNLWMRCSHTTISQLLKSILIGPSVSLMQFILDPSVHPIVISLAQKCGDEPLQIVFHLTRSWCFAIHRERLKLLQRWP